MKITPTRLTEYVHHNGGIQPPTLEILYAERQGFAIVLNESRLAYYSNRGYRKALAARELLAKALEQSDVDFYFPPDPPELSPHAGPGPERGRKPRDQRKPK